MHDGGLRQQWVRRILRDVLRGLQFLHSNGIVHGDIHSRNILSRVRLPSPQSKPPCSLEQTPEERNILEREDGKVDLWAPKYILCPKPLKEYVTSDEDPLINISDFGGGRTTLVSCR